MESRLITIVFIDMQGYTKRSATQNIEEMKLFHDQMFKFVGGIFEKFDGIMVKTMGDGFMARFDSPTKAVQAGIEIQRRLKSRNSQILNPDDIVRFRIGINTGEVGIDENGDLFGDPVNIAARIQTFADTNDVFIAEATYLAMNRNEFGAVDLGAQDLKNATREIRIYKVLQSGAPGVTIPHNKTAAPENAVKSEHIKYAVIAAVIFITLLLGVLIGRRRGRVQPVAQPAANQMTEHSQPDHAPSIENMANTELEPGLKQDPQPTHEQSPREATKGLTPPAQHRNVNGQGNRQTIRERLAQARKGAESHEKTFLELDLDDTSLNIEPHIKNIGTQIQQLAAKNDFDNALKLTMEQFHTTTNGKEIWALVAAELHWLNGDKKNAEEIFDRILEAARMPHARRIAQRRIAIIKKRSPFN